LNASVLPGQIAGLPLQAIIAGLLSVAVAATVHLLLWRARREPYLLLWGLAWIAFALRYMPMLWGVPFDASSKLSAIGTVRDLLFLSGAAQYTGRRWWRWLLLPAAVEILLILAGSLRHPILGSLGLGVRVVSSVTGIALVALVLARSERPGRRTRLLSSAGLLIIAGVLFAAPRLAETVSGSLAILIQIGALAYSVGIAFAELDEASAHRLGALRKLEGTMQHALRGHANVCVDCDRVEAADGAWRAPEAFVYSATNAMVTHGICPACAKREFGIDVADVPGAA